MFKEVLREAFLELEGSVEETSFKKFPKAHILWLTRACKFKQLYYDTVHHFARYD